MMRSHLNRIFDQAKVLAYLSRILDDKGALTGIFGVWCSASAKHTEN